MKNLRKKILRSILLSSVLSFLSPNAEAAPVNVNLDNDKNDDQDLINSLKSKIQKNVLKLVNNGDVKLIAAHRSHRSHRSHSSHRSSSSGSSYRSSGSSYRSSGSSYRSSGSSYRSSGSSYNSSSITSSSNLYSKPATPTKTAETYLLGDRTLKEGIYGNDVTSLVNLLVSKKYLHKDNVTKRSGYAVYDSNVKNAVVRFQNDALISNVGVVTTETISKLKSWDANKTTLVLGVRDLELNDSGDDVDMLIKLLTNAGFAPDPLKLEYDSKGKSKMTSDIKMAIKLFQAHHNLATTGNVDFPTLKKLKTYSK